MSKLFVLGFMGVVLSSVNAFADSGSVLEGVCWDANGWGIREYNMGGNATCLVNKDGSCVICGQDTIGCPGGCDGNGIGSPAVVMPGAEVGLFLCQNNGLWTKSQNFSCEGVGTTDPDPKPDPDPEPEPDPEVRCDNGKYTTVNSDGETVCAPCPVTDGLRLDTDYVDGDVNLLGTYIRSDGQNKFTCALSGMDMPFWQDNSGKFEIWDAACGWEE